ncbi:hypothetical protein BX600DRAFT_265313 [Xylariales sp. PMI_506]|nr:hypothetical protein BX600DRAFT_265313 [Xylariales sp. PMI_506]
MLASNLYTYANGKTSGLLNLFTADEVDALVAKKASSLDASSSVLRSDDMAALDVALAIGAQIHPECKLDPRIATAFIAQARQVAFEGMLANPSLSMVRLFLLLAFYMLGACHRNAASMYLGVASRAALLLNLHHPANSRNPIVEDYRIKSRTWNSLRILDVLTSFILGRPQSLPEVWYDAPPPTGITNSHIPQTGQNTFQAIIGGCRLIEDIVQRLRSGTVLHVPTAETLLAKLRHWTAQLPPTARVFAFSEGSELDSADRQALIDNIHLSCVYYFAVILITRPFLIAYLMSRLRGKAPDHLIDDPDEATDVRIKNNKVSKLAQVCVSSASYMADMCRKAQDAGFSFGNLCLLKAWLFGSGLILGFSMFAGEPRKDIENAFHSTLSVLDDIAQTSPQGRLYREILVSFSEAVDKYRKRVEREVHRTVQHYMDCILTVESINDVGHHYPSPGSGATYVEDGTGVSEFPATSSEFGPVQDMLGSKHQGGPGTATDDAMGEMSPDWNDFMQLDDANLALEMEEFEKLFYSVE